MSGHTLPFGRAISLSDISGPTYLTAQILVEQVVYTLVDHIFDYSVGNSAALRSWLEQGERNCRGDTPQIIDLVSRPEVGSMIHGFISRHKPDQIEAPIAILGLAPALPFLRPFLTDLIARYGILTPAMLLMVASDYASGDPAGLVSNYVQALSIATDTGAGLVCSLSAHEVQHMTLFTALMSLFIPTIHIYDGLRMLTETVRVIDTLDAAAVLRIYDSISDKISLSERKRGDYIGLTYSVMKSFNDELGTDYEPFEYRGHVNPQTVLVTFGSTEGSLFGKVVEAMSTNGVEVGVINVRIYRPFLEREFLKCLPTSVQNVAVIGEVLDQNSVLDLNVQSHLYMDVLATLVLVADEEHQSPRVYDFKHPRMQIWTPTNCAALVQQITQKLPTAPERDSLFSMPHDGSQQYSFWSLESMSTSNAFVHLSELLCEDSKLNVTCQKSHDNYTLGGVVRVDIRTSKKSIDLPYSIDHADFAYVDHVDLLDNFDIAGIVRKEGILLLRVDRYDFDALSSRLPTRCKRAIGVRKIRLIIMETSASHSLNEIKSFQESLIPAAFLKIVHTVDYQDFVSRLKTNSESFASLGNELDTMLHVVITPDSWTNVRSTDKRLGGLPRDLNITSYNSMIDGDIQESSGLVKKANEKEHENSALFKDAYEMSFVVDLENAPVSAALLLKMRRTLTVGGQDQEMFQLDFEIGRSGLKYELGDLMEICTENDVEKVSEFMIQYGLDPVEVSEEPIPQRPGFIARQSLQQYLCYDLDIFGRAHQQFYQALSQFTTDEHERDDLLLLGATADTGNDLENSSSMSRPTYADVLLGYKSARISAKDLTNMIPLLKPRQYWIASNPHSSPSTISIMVQTVGWTDAEQLTHYGQASNYLGKLENGKTAIVRLLKQNNAVQTPRPPPKSRQPVLIASIGTGLGPARAVIQETAWQKIRSPDIDPILLFLAIEDDSVYQEEWDAYQDSDVIKLIRSSLDDDKSVISLKANRSDIQTKWLKEQGIFYICGPKDQISHVWQEIEDILTDEARSNNLEIVVEDEMKRLEKEGRLVIYTY